MKNSTVMTALRPAHPLFATACGALLLCAATPPSHALMNPPIQRAPQGVEFMCGGQSSAEEWAFMERVSPRWGATLEFAVHGASRGSFAAPVHINMHNKFNGEHVLQANVQGPMMVARLAPGTYEVEATMGALTLKKTLVIRLGQPGRALFVWPSNVDLASVVQTPQTLTAQHTR